MGGRTFNGTYVNGVTLSNPVTELPATITAVGYITNLGAANDGTALLGEADAAWTITNLGRINGSSGKDSDGIRLLGGGFVTNGASGSSLGLITANFDAVEIEGRTGTVINYGAIIGLGTQGKGVALGAGGTVVNSGLIEGTAAAVAVTDARARLTNTGRIVSAIGAGVLLGRGGAVANGGTIEGHAFGAEISGKPGSITNAGTILTTGSAGVGVYLGRGGLVTNEASGRIAAARGDAVLVERGGTVVNLGTIAGASADSGAAINLDGGGSLVNGDAGRGGGRALISAAEIGVYIGRGGGPRDGAAGTVVNWGTIRSTGTASPAVLLMSGGTVVNHREISNAGSAAVVFRDRAGTLTNLGTIASGSPGAGGIGVELGRGGLVTNEKHGVIDGIAVGGARGVVVNYGAIRGGRSNGGAAIYLGHGGSIGNEEGALILGHGDGIIVEDLAGTVSNFGIIESVSPEKGAGVLLAAGGTLVNGGAGAPGALISAREIAVYAGGDVGSPKSGARATVVNWGTIQSTGRGAVAASAVRLLSGGEIVNHGLIRSAGHPAISLAERPGAVINSGSIVSTGGGSVGVAVSLAAGGRVSNEAGDIVGPFDAIEITGGRGVVVNLATITGGRETAVYLGAGGTVVNGSKSGAGGLIDGNRGRGVMLANSAGHVANFGTIRSSGSAAIAISAGGIVANHGLIASGGNSAIAFSGAAGTVVNFGTVLATPATEIGAAIHLADGGKITNWRRGLIEGGLDAGIFAEHADATIVNAGTIESLSQNGVYLAAGGTVTNLASGLIEGGVHGVYLLHPRGTVINHGTIDGGSAGFVTLGAGSETLINYGTIESAAGTAGVAVEIDGSIGGNVLVVEPHAVFVGSVLGGGKSEIEFIGGAVDMQGVDGFATIVLADGVKHSLSLTAANFTDVTGGVITIVDGNKGNAVNAGGVPQSFAIVVHVGSGGDTLTGGAGTNEFIFSAPGRNAITNFGFSLTNELVFSNSRFDLGLRFAATPQLLPARLFTANGSGSFTNPHQRFAYDTSNGDLFYSASGTTANERLVVVLGGAPPLTTTPYSHLFYIS